MKRNNNRAERRQLQSVFRAKVKADQESFPNKLADEVEEGLRSNHMGPAFRAIRTLTGSKSTSIASTINRADGSPCDSQEESVQRWQEHFEAALKPEPPSGPSSAALDAEAAQATADPSTSIDDRPPTLKNFFNDTKNLQI